MGKPPIRAYEGPKEPLSVRTPQKIIDRLQAIADSTGNELSTVVVDSLRWACEEWEAGEAKERAEQEAVKGRRSTDKPQKARRASDKPAEKAPDKAEKPKA